MATETDAARDRVLAARAALGEELETLEASARAAVDIPAKIRKSPMKAAAVAGGAGFVVLGGPRRVFRRVKRAVRGPEAPLPTSMLPDEIEKTLRALGTDGDKVRGTLERDFAAYTKQAAKDRTRLRTLLFVAVLRPLVLRASKVAAEKLFSTDAEGFQRRLGQVQARIARLEQRQAPAAKGGTGSSASGGDGPSAAGAVASSGPAASSGARSSGSTGSDRSGTAESGPAR